MSKLSSGVPAELEGLKKIRANEKMGVKINGNWINETKNSPLFMVFSLLVFGCSRDSVKRFCASRVKTVGGGNAGWTLPLTAPKRKAAVSVRKKEGVSKLD